MSTAEYTHAIESIFTDEWGGQTPIIYDNVDFVLPDVPEPMVMVEIYDGGVKRKSIGGSQFREMFYGTAFFTVFYPKSEGSAGCRELIDDIYTIFRQREESLLNGSIRFYDADISRIGEIYASGAGSSISSTVATTQWFKMTIGIPFQLNTIFV